MQMLLPYQISFIASEPIVCSSYTGSCRLGVVAGLAQCLHHNTANNNNNNSSSGSDNRPLTHRWMFAVTRVISASLSTRVCGIYSFDDIQQSHHSQAAASLIKARNKIIHHRQPTNYSWDRYYLMSEGVLTGGEETFLNIYVCIMMVVSVLLSHGEGETLFVITNLPILCILHGLLHAD